MKTCCREDVEGRHYPVPRARRNRGDPLEVPPWCFRSHKPMRADQRAIALAVLVRCVFERLETMALALVRWNPELLMLPGISLHMEKTRDERSCERNPFPTSLPVYLAISTQLFPFRFRHKITFTENWSCREV